MSPTILIMVIMLSTSSGTRALTTVQAEFKTAAACQQALDLNRAALTQGTVILATCNRVHNL